MIKLHSSSSYKHLYQQLKQLVVENHTLFSESWIVVPNHSAKLWLQKQLAKDLGVCAQIKFVMPLSFNWEALKNTTHSKYDHNVFSVDVIRWLIFQIINQDEFQFLKQESLLSEFNLSEKLARTFLAYCEDQPKIIQQWTQNKVKDSKKHQWQAKLWNCILDRLGEASPVGLLESFMPEKDFPHQTNIILFATEHLTTLQAETIIKLGEYQDIHLMLSNPCPEIYWFDIVTKNHKLRKNHYHPQSNEMLEVGHPLLASLGRTKMALFDTFLSRDVEPIDLVDIELGTANTLLQSLKQDIYLLTESPETFTSDQSIAIHSCHNKNREIEVIQDQILHQLNSNPELNPEDIIVLAPDINDYVSLIQLNFAEQLPYHIDRRRLADANYVITFIALLNSFSQEMTANNIYQILSHESLLENFKLSLNDLPRIKNWMTESNVRNYYCATTKAELGYEHKQTNTWQFGEHRWLSGYMAGNNDDLDYLSTYGDIAGQETLFQSVFKFLDLWNSTYKNFNQNHPPQTWFENIKTLCKDFLHNDFKKDFETKILKQLEQKFIVQSMDCEPEIPLTVVEQIIDKVVTENNYRSEGKIGIRFQTWENAFITDAEMLILIGLNEKDFPKSDTKNDMDLFQKQPAKLNKSIRLRDKNLMLSALSEDVEQLIISYIGFNEKNNEPQPPSILVSELIAYLQQKTNHEFQVQQHRMHGFNQCYFESSKNFNSYNQKNHTLAQSFYQTKKPTQAETVKLENELETEIYLHQLIDFFSDPLQYFLKHQIHLNPSIYADLLKDYETYQPDGLEKWQFKQQVFNHSTKTAAQTGIISDNKAGLQIQNSLNQKLKPLLETKQQLQEKWIETSLDGFKIHGNININLQGQLVSIFPKDIKNCGKQLCQHWIKHLCYQSELESLIYFENNTKIIIKPITDTKDSKPLLSLILQKWQNSFKSPWLLHPPSLLKTTTKVFATNTKENYFKGFVAGQHNHPSDGQKHFQNEVKDYDFTDDLNGFIQPILNHIEVYR